MIRRALVLDIVASVTFAASAAFASPALAPVVVVSAWSRPATDEAVVYATVRNTSDRPLVIVGASSLIAKTAELHQSMAMRGGSMNGMAMPAEGMRPVSRIRIPARGTLQLEPGGYHVMLLGLRHSLNVGERFPVTLRFAGGETATASVAVEQRAF